MWRLGSGSARVLVIDNYDSFTYNLVQILVTFDIEVEVFRNDALTVEQALARECVGMVLSPGPGRPEDAGICVDLLSRRSQVPLLGVCLGHQALGYAFGARIDSAPVLMHGKTSTIRSVAAPLFDGLPEEFTATRYHSLCVAEETLPEELEPLAWSEDGTLMAMRHRALPYWGVQFHPESVLTEVGPTLLGRFVELARASQRPVSMPPARTEQ